MKAFVLKETGGTENLIMSTAEKPEIKPGEVLIKVKAISINPVDAFVRRNKAGLLKMLRIEERKEGYILGWDISGTVVSSIENPVMIGKNVFGMINFPGYGKAYAEYVAAPVNQIALKPENITHEEASAATLAALTAWQAIVIHGKIKKNDKILIHAASGGVGHYAVQIAKHFGAYVISTASSSKKDFVLKLGTDEFIDYNNEDFEKKVKNADLVLDSIDSQEHLLKSINVCKDEGRLISIKSYFDDELNKKIAEKRLFADRILVKSDGNDIKHIAELLQNGSIKSHIEKVFSFNDLPEAHKQIETGRTKGKIIVRID